MPQITIHLPMGHKVVTTCHVISLLATLSVTLHQPVTIGFGAPL